MQKMSDVDEPIMKLLYISKYSYVNNVGSLLILVPFSRAVYLWTICDTVTGFYHRYYFLFYFLLLEINY